MLPVTIDTLRVFLHILAATVWVGGQVVLAGLVPTLRGLGPDAPRLVARRFNLLAWAAFAVLLVTGVWNLLVVDLSATSTSYHVTLGLKLLVVALAGVGAAAHAGARSKALLAAGGAVSLLGSLAAVWLGVMLAGS